MKTLIAYFTETGNTEKIARAIHQEVLSHGHEVHLKSIADVAPDDLNAYDLVFLGSACHDADLATPAKMFLEATPRSPSFKLAGFVTHATRTPEGGDRDRQYHEQWAGKCAESFERISQENDIELLGYSGCQGAPSQPIEAFIHRAIIPDEKEWQEYVTEARKHPNDKDMEQTREFARAVLRRPDATDAQPG